MLLNNVSGPNGFNSFNKLVLIFNVKVDGLNCLQLIQFLVVSDVDITLIKESNWFDLCAV